MHFVVLTLFKEMVETIMNTSIMGRALDKGLIDLDVIDIRDYAENKHNRVDDYPYGGGAGMVMVRASLLKEIIRSMPCLGHTWVCRCRASPQITLVCFSPMPRIMSGDSLVPLSSGRRNKGSCM